MFSNKGKGLPIVITIFMIVVIIYLFATLEQPLVVCEKRSKNDLDIVVSEVLETTLDSNEIRKMVLVKTIILPDEYLVDDTELDSIMFALEKSYQYLGDDKFTITKSEDRIIVRVEVEENETLILNNIEFFDNDGLQMRINSNTKSSDVLTLRIDDDYTEGEFMTRLKNNGYHCK
ncbi:MAG: hypothetical protein IJE53_03250 [Bacilli bacterium]|nr:hypothetical protein [Bacilli bacterium]